MQYFYAICMFFALLLSGCSGQTAPEASVNQANSNITKLGKRAFITALAEQFSAAAKLQVTAGFSWIWRHCCGDAAIKRI